MMFHRHGIGADEELAEIVDAGHHRSGFAFERSLPPAHQARVGFQFHEYVRTDPAALLEW